MRSVRTASLFAVALALGCAKTSPPPSPSTSSPSTSAPSTSAPAIAGNSGFFLVKLGRDTTSVEKYTRTSDRLEVQAVGRTPRVTKRNFTYDYANGMIKRFEMRAVPLGDSTAAQLLQVRFDVDSVRLESRTGSAAPRTLALVLPKDVLVVTNATPWASYEGEIMEFVNSKRETAQSPLWFVGAGTPNKLDLRKLDKDTVKLTTDRGDDYNVRVDAQGHIMSVEPIAGPAKYGVERPGSIDLAAFASAYEAGEKAGKGLGVLSPRDTLNVAFPGGSTFTLDYGRPSKRGRIVYGGVVPYDEVWRTGANAATQIRTDRPITFGSTTVPAGFYTLWTRPSKSGWKLIVNSETGQWGTAHNPEKDLYTIDMVVTALPTVIEQFTIGIQPTPKGGLLTMDWDTTRATAEFVFAK